MRIDIQGLWLGGEIIPQDFSTTVMQGNAGIKEGTSHEHLHSSCIVEPLATLLHPSEDIVCHQRYIL